MPALYRQYRPQTFGEIAGQAHITETLKQAILKNRISHAYLFQGPRGTGKTTTARILAKRLNCSKAKEAEPCGKCEACKAMQAARSLDVIEIDAASNRGIDDIRALREGVGLAPAMGTYKVYIIDEVHMLTNEAFAALLKTLEEPVKHVVFILATTELHKVPPTILSRCQVFRFRRATEQEMLERLRFLLKQENREAGDDVLDFIIHRSDGCYRDAESLLGQIITTSDKDISLDSITKALGLPSPHLITDFLTALVAKDSSKAIALADKAYQDGFDSEQFIQEGIRTARDGLLILTKGETTKEGIFSFATSPQASSRLPVIIRALVQAMQDIAYMPEPLIALQLAIVTACGPAPTATVAAQAPATATPSRKPSPPSAGSNFQFSPRPAPLKTASPAKTAAVPNSPNGTTIQQITDAWSQVIDKVKTTNPVSSTFLRATEPMAVQDREVTLRVQFPLHRNFFEKPEHKKVVEEALSTIVGTPLTIRCHLEQNTKPIAEIHQDNRKKEDELLKNVQEVFGLQA